MQPHTKRKILKGIPLPKLSLKRRFPGLPILLQTILIAANLHIIRASNSDSFGYTDADSNTPGGPTYAWIEISSTGIQLPPGSGGYADLGFSFSFYGTQY